MPCISTTYYILDNECSTAFKNDLKEENVAFELVPPNQRRHNSTKWARRKFKKHLLSEIATCDADFPLREWDWLISQDGLTINFLSNSSLNPKLSSWAYLFGNRDFNKFPLLLPGTKVILHAKPGKRASWVFHGK